MSDQYPDQSEFPEYWTDIRKDIGSRGDHYLPGRFFSRRDMNLLHSINSELYNDIIEILVQIFKVAVDETKTNIYGESDSETGKVFYNAIDMSCTYEPEDTSTDNSRKMGVDRNQNLIFKFRERDCIKANYFPEAGDLILFNERYFEINNVVQQQFLGGHPDKSWSFIVSTNYTRLSKINLVERQT